MLTLKVLVTHIIDKSAYPQWVQCKMYDANGKEHLFQDKLPIFCKNDKVELPCNGEIRCEEICRRENIVLIDTTHPDDVASIEGEQKFQVLDSQLTMD